MSKEKIYSIFQVPVSYLCGNGMIEMLELVEDIPGIDYNAPDTEGNTPLHYAAQAGHVEVVTFLLNKVRTIQVDPINILGFTPLMKAAIQGRVKCSKLLLISGNYSLLCLNIISKKEILYMSWISKNIFVSRCKFFSS